MAGGAESPELGAPGPQEGPQISSPDSTPPPSLVPPERQLWNWHVQNTDILQGDPGFPAKYSGTNSLLLGGEMRETVSLDLLAGVRLWRGAEFHVDGTHVARLWTEQDPRY